MFRVGIIGTENSHAMAFTRFFNLPQADTGEVPFPDIRIVGVYGKDPATAQQIIDEVDNTLFLAEKESDFIGKVDAMMITNRKGSEHAAAARPFIELGMPVFIDKPFTSDYAEAVELAEMAKRTGSKILAGSSVKLAPDVVTMQRIVTNLRASGEFLSASFNYPADFESIYDGFFFYSPHLVEMALAVLGEGIESVQAFKAENDVLVVAKYSDAYTSWHFTKGAQQYSVVVYGAKRNYLREVDLSLIYELECTKFASMLKYGTMPQTYEQITLPVRVIECIIESLDTGKPVTIR
ncbi:MAG: Gfo/Idh/MocA family oxidoreductase [Clostridiaceae bacterium]|nr:Gfo/Idh/MocA family oxidoreductase [Clostridiaceae bacterium]